MKNKDSFNNGAKGYSRKAKDKPPFIEKIVQWLDEYRLPLAALMLATALILGYFGFVGSLSAAGKTAPYMDAFYHTLRLLNPAATPIDIPLNTEVQIARILAAIAALYIAGEALISIFRDQIQMLRVRLVKGHIIICGLGQKGQLLADTYRSYGERVVIIEIDATNPMIKHCMDKGAIILTGNAADMELLRKARIDRAKAIISVCGNDAINAEVALFARQLVKDRKGRALACLVHVVDLHLWSFLREKEIRMGKLDIFRLSFFNIYDSGCRVLLHKYPPFDDLNSHKTVPHLVVIGAGKMARCLITTVARLWTNEANTDKKRISITIVDNKASTLTESLEVEYPKLKTICSLLPVDIDIDSPEFHRGTFLYDQNEKCDISKIYICPGDESAALSATLRLQEHLKQSGIPAVVRMKIGEGLSSLLQQSGEKAGSNIQVYAFPLLEESCTPELIWGGSTYEILAQAIHDDYIRNAVNRGETPETNRSMVPWEELSENLRESNRNQAEHILEKLESFGYDFALSADLYPTPVKFSADEIEKMSKMEHTRFVDERLRAGWRYGPHKDDNNKISPTLIPWDELSEEEKNKDRTTVAAIPEFLAKAGFQVYRTSQAD